ncbi:hypothetical protein [Streptomyces europaeiscabiei]|uniref:hypothetical protein n=1 Tax=Streptomyces europaeiscabiei TaxID=146819 RepID=UPI000AD42669|nr:hypothetical protein [Streptomyces europaeiscabiei]MDX3831362.1 hypothetical protein [Streptomyces europaeiscabiei]
MTAVVVVFAFIVAFSAIVCGHQGEDLPSFAARALRAVLRRTIRPTNRPRSNR